MRRMLRLSVLDRRRLLLPRPPPPAPAGKVAAATPQIELDQNGVGPTCPLLVELVAVKPRDWEALVEEGEGGGEGEKERETLSSLTIHLHYV